MQSRDFDYSCTLKYNDGKLSFMLRTKAGTRAVPRFCAIRPYTKKMTHKQTRERTVIKVVFVISFFFIF